MRARRRGFGLAIALGVHVFHEKTQSYGEAEKTRLKAVARTNSRKKWQNGEVGLAETVLKTSPHLARARRVAETQYTGWRAKHLAVAPSAALVLVEGGASPPAWLQNVDASSIAVKSCVLTHLQEACADYLEAPVFDYVVSTGPRGHARAAALARCHPNVVHVLADGAEPDVLGALSPTLGDVGAKHTAVNRR